MVNMEQTWREVLFDQKRRTLPKGQEPVNHSPMMTKNVLDLWNPYQLRIGSFRSEAVLLRGEHRVRRSRIPAGCKG
jgi:hypothetical protein